MNNKWIGYVQDFLVMVMNHLILLVVAIGIVGLFKETSPHLVSLTAMIIYPAGYYVARARVRHFVPFLLIHLLTPALVLLLPTGWLLKGLMVGMSFLYAVISMRIRYRENPAQDEFLSPLGVVVVIGALTLLENLYTKNGWEMYYLTIAILYFGLYFINYYLSQYLFLRTVNKSSTGVIPERAIFSSGVRQTMMFSLGSMAILFLMANIEWVAYLWSWIWKGIKALLRVLISLLPGEEAPEETEEEAVPEQGDSIVPDLGDEAGNELLEMIWKVLEQIAIVVVVVAAVALAVILTIRIFKYLRSCFYRRRERQVIELEGGVDIRESCDIEKEEKAATGWFGFFNPRERIRRIFRKKVLKNKANIVGERSAGVLEYMTAKECCSKLPEEKDASEVLKEMYEKARYSPEEVTTEDVRRLKAGK